MKDMEAACNTLMEEAGTCSISRLQVASCRAAKLQLVLNLVQEDHGFMAITVQQVLQALLMTIDKLNLVQEDHGFMAITVQQVLQALLMTIAKLAYRSKHSL
ncbi:hypothetical protein FRX31_035407 [Thalictrum thalictroides]|uniref:Uncharacterized protein n=1 Tax=Thalictrum thalictroides TaxID=46969 RepID=A0A7J6UR39_THATH|nr:hypothetical protein FRX31_035407 [Thalictrum thalictroides]